MSKMLDISTITRLHSTFSDKKWIYNDGQKEIYENFCQLLGNLDFEQQQLILELVDRYTWITLNEYQARLINILNSIPKEKIDPLKKIILFPIMKPEDEAKTKSGHTVLYMTYAFIPHLTNYKHIDFVKIESYEKIISEKFRLNSNSHIFLLDDYLGSGETIEATINKILENKSISTDQISVISIITERASVCFLEENNISCYTDMITLRGISDFYKSPDLEEKIKIMVEIEKLIPGNNFRFGHNESEGLITLLKTPDNTFPIFWMKHRKDSIKYNAPFERYQ